MAQPKPERTSIKEILKLVDQLPVEEQEQLVEEMKLQWLRKEVKRGLDQANNGESVDGDIVFAELEQRYRSKSE